jgi:hypothetical protein
MLPPFDIFRIHDGELVWQESAESLSLARLRVSMLRLAKPADYLILSQKTGHKTIVRQDGSQGEQHPICPQHESFMVPHSFQPRELSVVQGKLDGFRCPNLTCAVVYIEPLGGFHSLDDGKLTPLGSDAT